VAVTMVYRTWLVRVTPCREESGAVQFLRGPDGTGIERHSAEC
jgi:hypothetical protein